MNFLKREQYLSTPYSVLKLGALLYEGEDMALALIFMQLINANEYAGLLNFAELMVDGRAKDKHGGREIHISIDKWGYIATTLTHIGIEDAVIEFKVILGEEFAKLLGVVLQKERMISTDHVATVAKVLVEKIEYHIACQAIV